jgi:hypothetical protein
MPLLDLCKLTVGLSGPWAASYRIGAGHSLRATPGDHPLQLPAGRCPAGPVSGEHSPDPDADSAAAGPAEVTRAHVSPRPGSIAGGRGFALDEDEVARIDGLSRQ